MVNWWFSTWCNEILIDYISRLITSSKYILFLISSQKTHNLKCMCCPWTQFILTSTISVCVFFRSSKMICSKPEFHVGNKNRKYFDSFQTPVFYQDTKKMAAIALYCQRKIKGRCQHSLVNFFLIKKKRNMNPISQQKPYYNYTVLIWLYL